MRALVIAWLLVTAALVGSHVAAEKRALQRDVRAEANDDRRLVDFGVTMRVVRMDLEHGDYLLPDCPPLTVLREHSFGGMVDTWGAASDGRPDFVGPSVDPAIWYCSEDAEPIILHGDDMPGRLLVYGSEGAGKTRVLVMWAGLQVLEATGSGHIIGLTSPTNPRAAEIVEAVGELWPESWYRFADKKKTFTCRNGVRLQLQSTYKQSKKAGSRVQTFNWRSAASDEIQDSLDADADIEMRGRKAPGGAMKRLCTATSKDSSEFRAWREKALVAKDNDGRLLWEKRVLLGRRSPFIWPKFWDEKSGTLSKREARRRIGAEDLPSENRVYYGFTREKNILVKPEVARDIAAEVLGIFRPLARKYRGSPFGMLAGHDPGEIRNVTHLFKPYLYRDAILWLVIDRYITQRTTAEKHAAGLKRHVQEKHGLNYEDDDSASPRLLVMCDPHGRGDSNTDYDTVYGAFIREGLDIFNPAGDASKIPSQARRDMMNSLLDPEVGEARLCVAKDADGTICAPELVEAFEELERDAGGRAEKGKKNENDKTHHPVSCGYGLWPFENPGVALETHKRVMQALGHHRRRRGAA